MGFNGILGGPFAMYCRPCVGGLVEAVHTIFNTQSKKAITRNLFYYLPLVLWWFEMKVEGKVRESRGERYFAY